MTHGYVCICINGITKQPRGSVLWLVDIADRGFDTRLGQIVDYQIVIYPLSSWKLMCPNGTTYLLLNSCFSELALYKSNLKTWSRWFIKNRHHTPLIGNFLPPSYTVAVKSTNVQQCLFIRFLFPFHFFLSFSVSSRINGDTYKSFFIYMFILYLLGTHIFMFEYISSLKKKLEWFEIDMKSTPWCPCQIYIYYDTKS